MQRVLHLLIVHVYFPSEHTHLLLNVWPLRIFHLSLALKILSGIAVINILPWGCTGVVSSGFAQVKYILCKLFVNI